jgi:hypothetical protein
MGNTKGKAAEFCGRPECKSVQHKLHWEVFSAAGKKPHLSRKQKARRRLREKEVVSIDDLTQAY